jgi:hypothetical protein
MGAKWAFQRDIGHTGDFVLLLFYYQGAGHPYIQLTNTPRRSETSIIQYIYYLSKEPSEILSRNHYPDDVAN